MGWLIFAAIIVLAALGTPIFALIGGLAVFLFHAAQSPAPGLSVITELMRLADMPSLIAVPLFTFAGYVLAESQAPQRLIALAEASFGWMPGGVAIAGLCACALFTAFTGASGVTIIALGGLIYPLLRKQQYPDGFSLGLVTTTGSLGLLFPPSLPIILYALVGKLSIDRLFAAAAGPGIILLIVLGAYAFVVAKKHNVPRIPFSAKVLARAARNAAWEIPLPFIVVGGIYAGIFTASEAAAIMAFYVVVAEVLVYRDLRLAQLPGTMARSMMLVGAIIAVLGTALGLTNYMIDAEIPSRLFELLRQHISSQWGFLALLNVFLLVVNMVEIFSAIIIVVPIIVPVAMGFQVDPIHLGALFLLNLEIGYMTPPMGLNLFLSSRRFERPLPDLYKATMPFWAVLVAALALVTYVPQVSLWLPNALHIH